MSDFDLLVIGSGPAGQKAAIQAAKAGRRVLVVERELAVGGACVHRGTIPSKTLRETAVALVGFRRRIGGVFDVTLPRDLQITSLMTRMEAVVTAHERFLDDQLRRNRVTVWRGRARFAHRTSSRSRHRAKAVATPRPSSSSWPAAHAHARPRASPSTTSTSSTPTRSCR